MFINVGLRMMDGKGR